MTKTVLLSTI